MLALLGLRPSLTGPWAGHVPVMLVWCGVPVRLLCGCWLLRDDIVPHSPPPSPECPTVSLAWRCLAACQLPANYLSLSVVACLLSWNVPDSCSRQQRRKGVEVSSMRGLSHLGRRREGEGHQSKVAAVLLLRLRLLLGICNQPTPEIPDHSNPSLPCHTTPWSGGLLPKITSTFA